MIVPYGLDISDEEIENRVKEQIKEKSGFNAVMHVEHPFIES